ncbi:MAG: hypothetical protein ACFB51_21500 [Anaerolineae bacterium]
MLRATFKLANGTRVTLQGPEQLVRALSPPDAETVMLPDENGPAALRATLRRPNETWIAVEGEQSDIGELLAYFAEHPPPQQTAPLAPRPVTALALPSPLLSMLAQMPPPEKPAMTTTAADEIDIAWIAEKIQTCAEAPVIQTNILGGTSQADKVMMVLYVLNTYASPSATLTAREISEVLEAVESPMAQPNVNKMFRTHAQEYVKKDDSGRAARFRLNRRGMKLMAKRLAQPALL